MREDQYRMMTRHENMSDTKRLMGLLPLYVGMEVRLTERILAPSDKDPVGVVPDCLGTVVEIILHPSEGNILERGCEDYPTPNLV